MGELFLRGLSLGSVSGGGSARLTDLHVGNGELLVVAGPGKSTLLNAIEGVGHTERGDVIAGAAGLGQGRATEWDLKLVRAPRPGQPMVVGAALIPEQDVLGNLQAAARWGGHTDDARDAVTRVGSLLGLERVLKVGVTELSDEDKRRLAIAVSLLGNPGTVLLDDPAHGLDPHARARLSKDLAHALRDLKLTAIYATTDPDEAFMLGDRIAYVDDGEIQQIGTPEELTSAPATVDVARFANRGRMRFSRGRIDHGALQVGSTKYQLPAQFDPATEQEVTVGILRDDEPEASVQVFDARSGRVIAVEEGEPPSRVVNLTLSSGGRRIEPDEAIPGSSTAELELQIGPWREDSMVENALRNPFPELAKSREGHMLEVVVSSDEIEASAASHELYLPDEGSSSVLPIALTFPADDGTGTIRIALYHRQHLLQSLLATFSWGTLVDDDTSHHAVVDFTLSDLHDVARLPERDLTLLLNDNGNSTHRLIVNQRGDDPFDVTLFENQMDGAITHARAMLLGRHMDAHGNTRFRDGTRKSATDLTEDLMVLANVGARLYEQIVLGREERRRIKERLAERKWPAQIQVGYTEGQPLIFPWALVYDIPLDLRGTRRPCKILDELDTGNPPSELDPVCPHAATHSLNTVCPYGFWGFAHVIEVPPTLGPGADLKLCVRKGPPDDKVVLGISLDMDDELATKHLERLPAGWALDRCETRDKLNKALGVAEREFVYFYCHGKKVASDGYGRPVTVLEIGDEQDEQWIYTGDILNWADPDAGWPKDHWDRTAPLVVINGCATAAKTTLDAGDFASAFIDAGASGVVGTEIPLDQPVAGEAVEVFFRLLLEPEATVGSSLYGMRRTLLANGNVMGLGYTAYCSSSLRLRCPSST